MNTGHLATLLADLARTTGGHTVYAEAVVSEAQLERVAGEHGLEITRYAAGRCVAIEFAELDARLHLYARTPE